MINKDFCLHNYQLIPKIRLTKSAVGLCFLPAPFTMQAMGKARKGKKKGDILLPGNQKEVALSFQGLDPQVGIVFEILPELSNVYIQVSGVEE